MLLFILARTSFSRTSEHFNTSHVTVYRWKSRCWMEKIKFQYISCYCLSASAVQGRKIFGISIHLMLLFIWICRFLPETEKDFNTSHVTVYQTMHLEWSQNSTHFNTSHVTVYREKSWKHLDNWIYFNTSHVTVYPPSCAYILTANWFQYISCYCLSIFFYCCQLACEYFNTSHVTVYQNQQINTAKSLLFQYISCYCLSLYLFW